VVGLGRDAVIARLRPAPRSELGPVKNVFPLERPLPRNALALTKGETELETEDDGFAVTWAGGDASLGTVRLDIRCSGHGHSDVVLHPGRHAPPRWERRARWVAWTLVILPFVLHVHGVNLLLPLGLVLFAVLSHRNTARKDYARRCDALADEVLARLQPFVLPASELAPYRSL
jgi:hypothetical protein